MSIKWNIDSSLISHHYSVILSWHKLWTSLHSCEWSEPQGCSSGQRENLYLPTSFSGLLTLPSEQLTLHWEQVAELCNVSILDFFNIQILWLCLHHLLERAWAVEVDNSYSKLWFYHHVALKNYVTVPLCPQSWREKYSRHRAPAIANWISLECWPYLKIWLFF